MEERKRALKPEARIVQRTAGATGQLVEHVLSVVRSGMVRRCGTRSVGQAYDSANDATQEVHVAVTKTRHLP
ncbi:hypothetical protein [Lentzea guizhouensis]|uniref:hypothetical protein n=1 Tax=Lentzea guizhouensis TaxID=1586287 RepID=UPI0012B69EB6|nr:hypothetical protein [Lentzea guizhouensis]